MGLENDTIVIMFTARLLATLIFIAVPLGALAQADASLLGPAGTTNQSGGASTETLNTLQPASPSALQTTGGTGSSQTSDQSSLQQPATGQQAQLFVQGDAQGSGSSQNDTGGTNPLWYQLGILVTIAAVIVFVVAIARRDLARVSSPLTAENSNKPNRKKRPKKAKS